MEEQDSLSSLTQQRLKSWRPILTPKKFIIVMYSIAVVSICFGGLLIAFFNKAQCIDVRYDDKCAINTVCTVSIDVPKKLSGDIRLEYGLTKFYQNHRQYMNSKSVAQLKGDYVEYSGLSGCKPFRSVNDSSDPSQLYLPSGAFPVSFFNDTFTWMGSQQFSEDGISWKSDRDYLFKNLSSQYKAGIRWLEEYTDFPGAQTNEHFIVWMRTAAFPKFIKLYGRCTHCYIPKDNYTVYVGYNYPLELFSGGRWIVISMTSGIGGGSNLIAISYVASGGLSLMIGLCFLVQTLLCPRKLGDITGFARKH